MLRKLILGSSSWMLLGAAASAADLPAVAKVPPATAQSWAGFYLGGHGGYGWGRNDFFRTFNPFTLEGLTGINSRGPVYGVQAGYNWQHGRIVTGVELDFSAADINGSSSLSGFIPGQGAFLLNFAERTKYLGTARAAGLAAGRQCSDLRHGRRRMAARRRDCNANDRPAHQRGFRSTAAARPVRLGRGCRRGSEVARLELDRPP
jgi:opacity protein-like surface antigen